MLPVLFGLIVAAGVAFAFLGVKRVTLAKHEVGIVFPKKEKKQPKRILRDLAIYYPWWEQLELLKLDALMVKVDTQDTESRDGVRMNISAVAQVRLEGGEEALPQTIKLYLGKSKQDLRTMLVPHLERHLTAATKRMTFEEIYGDWSALAAVAREWATSDLASKNVELQSFSVMEVMDREGKVAEIRKKR